MAWENKGLKLEGEDDVLIAAKKRVHQLYDRFDTVAVGFSGGKDSTCALNIALEVARERGKLPLEVYFFDEEAIAPETVEYCERIRKNPDINFKWLCVQVKHRNACSREEPFWFPWDENKKDLWVRDLPENVISDFDGFHKGMSMPTALLRIYPQSEFGTVAHIRGIRAQESVRRLQMVTSRVDDNWISGATRAFYSKANREWQTGNGGHCYPCCPIYDWTDLDVWTAPRLLGWDYNRAYDVMAAMGQTMHQQRVGPPWGEEPLVNLGMYKVCWQELWDKMQNRVAGSATASRYAKTELYGYRDIKKPLGVTWQKHCLTLLERWNVNERALIAKSMQGIIAKHKKLTSRPIPDEKADEVSGLSWKWLCISVSRGDMKGRRKGKLIVNATSAAAKAGKTREEAEQHAIDNMLDFRY